MGNSIKKFSGAHIKWLAIGLMLVDHIGCVILEPLALQYGLSSSIDMYEKYRQIMNVDMVLRALGRFSFPAFCFLLVEGFVHTRSREKYLRNLAIFAMVSEIPFNRAVGRQLFTIQYQNVFFTLAIGFVAIWIAEQLRMKVLQQGGSEQLFTIVMAVEVCSLAIAAEFLNTDYGAVGVWVIAIFYLLYQKPVWAAITAWGFLSLLSSSLEIYCFPIILAIWCYNGKRGKQPKYFFYVFYPLHLLILVGIRMLII